MPISRLFLQSINPLLVHLAEKLCECGTAWVYHIHGPSHAGSREAACSCLRHRPSVDQLWPVTNFARPPMSHLLEQQGFAVVHQVLTTSEREQLIESLGPVTRAGRRGLLAVPIVAQLVRSSRLLDIVRPHLPADPRPVRAIYFDKVPGA